MIILHFSIVIARLSCGLPDGICQLTNEKHSPLLRRPDAKRLEEVDFQHGFRLHIEAKE